MSGMSDHRTLSLVLWLDAAACALTGGVLLAFGDLIAALTGLPVLLLTVAGVLLLPVAVIMAACARWPVRWLLQMIVLGNIAWILASLAVIALPQVPMNVLGVAFVLAQALFVVVMVLLERRGLTALQSAQGEAAA